MAAAGVLRTLEGSRLGFTCPGCREMHVVSAHTADQPGPGWTWNGSYVRPTFTPSILIRSGHYVPGQPPGSGCWCTYNAEHPDKPAPFSCSICHSFVTDGQIHFLTDCTHDMAGLIVPLLPLEENGPDADQP